MTGKPALISAFIGGGKQGAVILTMKLPKLMRTSSMF